MSQQGEHIERAYLASEDLTGKRYYGAKVDNTDENKVLLNDSSGGFVVGVFQEDPGDLSSTNGDVIMTVGGHMKAKLGATVNEGERVMSNASGLAIKVTAALYYFGVCMQAGVVNDIVEIDGNKNGYEPA